jgi:recombination protein RecR
MESTEIKSLIKLMSKIPGLGPRSARRAVLSLLQNPRKKLIPLAETMLQTAKQIKLCSTCGNIDVYNPCLICVDEQRDSTTICIVEEIADLWAIERSKIYKGRYHVLGGVLSAIDGITAEDLRIDQLINHIKKIKVKEVILATSATVAGQTTSYYISDLLKNMEIKITRLAQGVPMGGELDYLDEGTIGSAISLRHPITKK